jgi:succinate dehydrogenase / fumarate reductase flavoprotein subunit
MALGEFANASTNIPGLYAFGEVNFAYHGANRLGANALLSCLFDGLFCGVSVANYIKDGPAKKAPSESLAPAAYEQAVRSEEARYKQLVDTSGRAGDASTNPYVIHKELGDEMTTACTVVKSEARLKQCLNKLAELKDRFRRVSVQDSAAWTNQTVGYTRSVGDMLIVAEAIAKGSLERRESRGAHYRTDYTERDDANFMKTTLAKYDAASDSVSISFASIDASLIKPTARTYGKTESKKDGPAPVASSPAPAHV